MQYAQTYGLDTWKKKMHNIKSWPLT